MAGLMSFTFAGLSFLLISALESLLPFHHHPLLPRLHRLSTLLLSSLFLLYSLLSSLLSPSSHLDPLSPPLPLSSLPVFALFLLHSLSSFPPLFAPLLPLLSLAAFSLEILLLLLRRHDPSGVESHYFSLLLVPALVCFASTIVSLSRPNSPSPRLARAAALALHGTWLIQMGFSFFSPAAIADGCFLKRRSWANYTVACKGHPEYHRARAIGTLQFNCHLALMVVVAVGVYSVLSRGGGAGAGASKGYRPLNKETEMVGGGGGNALRFALDSDEEEDVELEAKTVGVVAEARNGSGESH